MEEAWKNIMGFEGVYQISSNGNIKSFKKVASGRIMSNKNAKGDYLSVVLCKGNLRRFTRIHRLVAESFIPNPENKPQVNHIDGNKQNNRVDNLEWVTEKENIAHAVAMNPKMLNGINKYNKFVRPSIVQQYSVSGELLREFPSAQEAERSTGVCGRNILQVANHTEYRPGKTRSQAGGFSWKFKTIGGCVNGH